MIAAIAWLVLLLVAVGCAVFMAVGMRSLLEAIRNRSEICVPIFIIAVLIPGLAIGLTVDLLSTPFRTHPSTSDPVWTTGHGPRAHETRIEKMQIQKVEERS